MVRAKCGWKFVDRKTTEEQMDVLWLKETVDRLATANGVTWYRHELRRDDDGVLRVALDPEVKVRRKQGRPKKDLTKASGRGVREEGGYPKSSKVERWNANNCRRNGVNPTISAKGKVQFKTELLFQYYSISK